jgi:hypothetical protein
MKALGKSVYAINCIRADCLSIQNYKLITFIFQKGEYLFFELKVVFKKVIESCL